MSRQVLYRQYRPDTFADLIGQDTVITALSRAIESGRLAHAYLFSGPRGCGKTSSARIFARCLNCEKGPTPTPCGKCPSCVELATGGGGSVDVIEMDAASNNGVDNARELRERLTYAPSRDRFKILILDEAHRITAAAFDALLKIVEEPPEHVKFIFATTEPEKVISTIRSRTYHYSFNLVPPAIMTPFLKKIVEQENMELDERVYPLLVRIGGGSVRDTLSNLDQLLSSAKDNKIEYDFTNKLFGFTPTEVIHKAMDILVIGDFSAFFDHIEQMILEGVSPKSFTLDFLNWMRDALLIKMVDNDIKKGDTENIRVALGEYSDDDLAYLSDFASKIDAGLLHKYAMILDQGVRNMSGITSERLELELVIGEFAVASGIWALPSTNSASITTTPAAVKPTVQAKNPTKTPSIAPENVAKKPTDIAQSTANTPALPSLEGNLTKEEFIGVIKNVHSDETSLLKGNGGLKSIANGVAVIKINDAAVRAEFIEKGYDKSFAKLITEKTSKNIEIKIFDDGGSVVPVKNANANDSSSKTKNSADEPVSDDIPVQSPVESTVNKDEDNKDTAGKESLVDTTDIDEMLRKELGAEEL